jgi:hypothetical protein
MLRKQNAGSASDQTAANLFVIREIWQAVNEYRECSFSRAARILAKLFMQA